MDNINYTPIQVYQMRLSDEILRFPQGFWDIETANTIIRFLIEEVIKCDDIDIQYHRFTKQFFKKYKLGGMLQILFENSAQNAIKSAYPNGFTIDEKILNSSSEALRLGKSITEVTYDILRQRGEL